MTSEISSPLRTHNVSQCLRAGLAQVALLAIHVHTNTATYSRTAAAPIKRTLPRSLYWKCRTITAPQVRPSRYLSGVDVSVAGYGSYVQTAAKRQAGP